MRYLILATGLVALLTACDSSGENPFDDPVDDETTEEADDGTAVDSDGTLPPGTASPTPSSSIFRKESTDGNVGDGYAEGFAYDSTNDTFTVDGPGL